VTSCIVDGAAIYIMVVKFRNTISPLHRSFPFIGGLRCQAIQTEHGPYKTERTQKAVYIVNDARTFPTVMTTFLVQDLNEKSVDCMLH
jgi:hypothetical protein